MFCFCPFLAVNAALNKRRLLFCVQQGLTPLKTAGFPLRSRVIRPLEVHVETSPTRRFYKSFAHVISVPVTGSQKSVTWCAPASEVVVSDSPDPLLLLLAAQPSSTSREPS